MLLSLLTQGVLDITSGVIIWSFKKSYNMVCYLFYKNDKEEYIMIKQIEYIVVLLFQNKQELYLHLNHHLQTQIQYFI